MSVDLCVSIEALFTIQNVKILTHMVLKELLNAKTIPKIKIEKLEDGSIHPLANDSQVNIQTVYCLQYEGKDDNVLVIPTDKMEYFDPNNGYNVTFLVGSTRTPEEYVLGLAGAIAMGIKFNSMVEDGQLFWTDSLESDPIQLLEKFAVKNTEEMTFSAACKQLVGNRLD